MDDPFNMLIGLDDIDICAESTDAPAAAGSVDAACAPAAAGSSDVACAQCGAQMHYGTNELELTCENCGLVIEEEMTEQDEDKTTSSARLRIVGINSNQLQPDLYRSGGGNTSANQINQLYNEYCAYRTLYIESGGRAFSLDACRRAAEYYNEVQQQCVKRSENKKAIMAACFDQACLELGFSPSKTEIATFMQLPTKGIARGKNFVRSLVADGKMDVNINMDPCKPEITTLFAYIGFEGEEYRSLYDAVYEIVQIAIQNNIGTNSILRSKVAGATFEVLRRCKGIKVMNIQDFCQNKVIRKNTVERFTHQLGEYHSFFAETYAKHGLNCEERVACGKHAAKAM